MALEVVASPSQQAGFWSCWPFQIPERD